MPQITYNLPPYVELIDNPHYTGSVFGSPPQIVTNSSNISPLTVTLPINDQQKSIYAPFRLRSLGNYPLGQYQISVPNNTRYSGTFNAIKTTNTSITLQCPSISETYPIKSQDQYMDVNSYSFAYKKYPFSYLPGGLAPFEKYYDLLVYDYNCEGWKNSTSFVQHHIVENIFFLGKIPNSYEYGHSVIYLPELPFNVKRAISDPTGLKLIPYSERTSLEGRFFVLIKRMPGSNQIDYQFFPELPIDKNIEIWLEPIEGSSKRPINGIRRGSGARLNIIYDGFFWSNGGFDSGTVLPAIKNKKSEKQPALITLPQGSNYGAFRFYSGTRRSKDFDLYRNLLINPAGTVINNAIPGNFSSSQR